MAQQDKSFFYRALKDAGVELGKQYRDYTTSELKQAYDALQAGTAEQGQPPQYEERVEVPVAAKPAEGLAGEPPASAPQQGYAALEAPQEQPQNRVPASPPVRERDPAELPGARLNANPEMAPIRTDENGLIWYQEEVLKPANAKPRGRRVLKYLDTGTKQQTVQDGDFIETFEVAGDRMGQLAEVKITLPSFQVGIYKDPRYPFKIHVYNERRAFDREEVEKFYGGRELVPAEVKRVYVENVLCYDMRTVIRAIQTEYRQQQLAGRIR